MDDNFVKPIPDEAVLKQSSVPKVAYLLFYRRVDTILEHRKKDWLVTESQNLNQLHERHELIEIQ